MIDVTKMIDLAKEHGFEVLENKDSPGFFKKNQEVNIKLTLDQLVSIVSPEVVTLPDNFFWEGIEKRVLRVSRKLNFYNEFKFWVQYVDNDEKVVA